MQPEVAASLTSCAASPGHELFGDLPLVPGAHTVQVSSADDGVGEVLVEVYEITE